MSQMSQSLMQRPTPSGWRWLLNCALACMAVVLIVAGAWAYWSQEANRRLDATIADLRAKGRALRWADLKYDDVPDELNAATHLRAAWAAYVPTTTLPGYSRSVVGTPAWQTMAQAEVAANPQALALARKARPFDRVCWVRPTPGVSLPVIPQFPNVSNFARLLHAAAILHHQQGQETQAIECWRDIEHMQRMISGDSHTLIGGLISMIESGIGTDAMIRIAPTLRFGDAGGMDPTDARKLIRELLDTDQLKHAVAEGFHFEGMGATNFVLGGEMDKSPWLLRPGFLMSMNRRMVGMEAAADECEHLRYSPPGPPPRPTQTPFDCVTPQFSNVAQDVIHEILRRRVAAVTVAVCLYRHETGRFPASLDQLVPQYLPNVPMDSRNQDKTPLGYVLVEDGQRPMLYSAGIAKPPVSQPPKQRAEITSSSGPQSAVLWQDLSAPPK